jgi:biopolymer transport protein TolQ
MATNSILQLVLSLDLMGKAILMILLICSVISWSIIFSKYRLYKLSIRKINAFQTIFQSGQILNKIYEHTKKSNKENPLMSIFTAGMKEMKDIGNNNNLLSQNSKDRILNVMYLMRNKELEHLQQSIPYLGTIGAISPFVGLFGMVWAITVTFLSISASKNVTIAIIAPGISQSLFITAAGLLVAIPSATFYNIFNTKLDEINNKIDDFILDLYTTFLKQNV